MSPEPSFLIERAFERLEERKIDLLKREAQLEQDRQSFTEDTMKLLGIPPPERDRQVHIYEIAKAAFNVAMKDVKETLATQDIEPLAHTNPGGSYGDESSMPS